MSALVYNRPLLLASQQQTWRKRGSWIRTCQIVSVLAAILMLYSVALISQTMDATSALLRAHNGATKNNQHFTNISEEWRLIDITNFKYDLNPLNICDSENIYILTYVHSKPEHFVERSVIRSTWGSVRNISRWELRVVFLLGLTSEEVQRNVEIENSVHGDIVQGNFLDSYRNLTYKHVMGYKWVLSHCGATRVVLKTDDDAFVDVFQLFHFLMTYYGARPHATLICNVLPAGTKPQREGKWKVSNTEYPDETYPKYCAGLAYVTTPDLIRRLYSATSMVPYFWIDDVYATGLLSKKLGLQTMSYNQLNLRTTYDIAPLLKWSASNDSGHPSPYLVATADYNNITKVFPLLWMKTVNVELAQQSRHTKKPR